MISPLLHRTGRMLRIPALNQRVALRGRYLAFPTPNVARPAPPHRPVTFLRPTTSWEVSGEDPTWEDAEWQ